jgi:hypothetical protein
MRIWLLSVAVLSIIGTVWVASAAGDGRFSTSAPAATPAPAAGPAAPTTGPVVAAPQSHHESPGRDWVQVTNKTGGFSFYVPKKWGTGSTGDSDSFTLPAPVIKPPAQSTSPNAPQISMNPKQSVFSITVQKGKATTLKAAADSAKAAAFTTPDDEGNKTDADAATTLDGKPAWLLETEEKYVAGTATTNEPNKPAKSRDIKRSAKTYQIISVVGDNLYTISFVADGGHYSSGLDTVKKVLETFQWATDAK